MAVGGQANTSWQSVRLPFNLVTFLLEQYFGQSCIQPQQQPRQRRLKGGIDANLVGYKHIHDRSPFAPDAAVGLVAETFSAALFDMHITADHPTKRHPSKRASCDRRAKREKTAIRLIITRAHLQSLLNVQDTSSEHADKINEAQKKLRGTENSLKRQQLPDDFSQRLQEFSGTFEPENRGSITMEVAPTQADPCLAKMAVDGEIDFIVSGDSDFSVYIGPNGPYGTADIMLMDLKLTTKKEQPIRSCRVYTGQKKAADLIEAILRPKLGYSPFDTDKENKEKDGRTPNYPIFSGVQDPMTRALMAMVVGCDACPGGVVGAGPKAASDLIAKHSGLSGDALHLALAEDISKMKGATVVERDAVLCLAKSMLYEKTNTGYIHDEPAVLEKYLEEFASPNTEVIDGPRIATCKGCSGISHPFLAAEGSFTCGSCEATLCQFCFMREADEEHLEGTRLLCLECMRGAISGMTEGEDEAEMRAFLAEKGQAVPARATYLQVLDLFEKAEAGEFDIFEDDIKNVKFPILATSALHPSQPDFERIKEVPVHEMERLIVDSNIPMAVVTDLLHILASLTRVEARKKGEKLTYRHVLPSNVIKMAENARVHTGERLCKRGLRHALDDGTPDILNAKLTLARHGSHVCIIIGHQILASMKSVLYTASSAITATEFLASECNCKAGCQNHGPSNLGKHRTICTHSMTEPVQLSQLMYKGMAMQVLVDFRRRVRREGVDSLEDASRQKQLRVDIILLIKATGQCPPALGADATILELLEDYAESTGRAKMSPGEPNPRDLGLLRDKAKYCRPEAKAEKAMKNENDGSMGEGNSTIPNIPKGTVTVEKYMAIGVADDGISFLFGQDEFKYLRSDAEKKEPIGFELRSFRGRTDDALQLDYSTRHQHRLEYANKLKSLLLQGTQKRGLGKSPPLANALKVTASKKRAASTNSNVPPTKKTRRGTKYCCVCGNNNLNSKIGRVPDYNVRPNDSYNAVRRYQHVLAAHRAQERKDPVEQEETALSLKNALSLNTNELENF